MSHARKNWPTLFAAWVLCFAAEVAAEAPRCPPRLAPGTLVAAQTDPDWHLNQELPLELSGIGFMAGPPSSRTHLVPDEDRKVGATSTAVWRFSGDEPQGKWLACFYGSSRIVMGRLLPAAAMQCTVRRQTGTARQPWRLITLDCRDAAGRPLQ